MNLKTIDKHLKDLDDYFSDISNINKDRIISFINKLKSYLFPKCYKCEYTIKRIYIELLEILSFLGFFFLGFPSSFSPSSSSSSKGTSISGSFNKPKNTYKSRESIF